MSEKNLDQIKALYTELSKLAPTQDWEKILKVAKKSKGQSFIFVNGVIYFYKKF